MQKKRVFTVWNEFWPGLAVRSKADETLIIVETLICPLQVYDTVYYCSMLSFHSDLK